MTDLAVLNHAEQVALDECERVIGEGIKTFVAVGSSLSFVRDNRLYRADYATFGAYCRKRWNLTPQHANRLALAAGVVTSMEPMGSVPPPSSERQARELAKVPEPERAGVWAETVERTEGKPTAKAIRAVREKRTQTPGPSDAAVTPPVDPGTAPAPAVESPVLADPQEPDRSAEKFAALDGQLDAEMEGTATRFRRNFSAAVARADDVWSFDAERIAEVYSGDFNNEIRPFLDQMTRWCEQVAAAHRRTSGLRVMNGGKS